MGAHAPVRAEAVNPLASLRTAIIGASAGAVLGVGLYFKGRADGMAAATATCRVQAARAEAASERQQAVTAVQTAALRQRVAELTQEEADASSRLDRMYRDVLRSVSDRRSRPVPPAAGADTTAPRPVPGTDRLGTGAELYREDAEFLAGEAARADQIRLALVTCRTQYQVMADLLTPAPVPR